ncbi:MAG TPA: phosphatase PAP2 family protein [Gemmatimonadaceae bacterium]
MTVPRRWRAAAIALLLGWNTAAAQTRDSVQKTFFVPRDGAIGAAFAVASIGLSAFDVRLARNFQDTTNLHVRAGRRADDVFTNVNETTLTVGGLAVYAIARLAKNETVADIAFHTAASVAAASVTAQLIRGPLGRTRPLNTNPPFGDQYDFHFLKGFGNFSNRAFPSIHSSSGFAAASAIVAETKRRARGSVWYVAVPAYAIALTPGLARMYLGQHWASDIFAGAFLGTFYGWRVVDYSHDHKQTAVDKVFLGVDRGTAPRANEYKIGWTVQF